MPCVRPRTDVEGGGEGPMTTKRREQRRARITMVPPSSWTKMLLTPGSELWRVLSGSSSDEGPEAEGSAALIVPAAVMGL
jgi:hypothetical protein